MTSPFIVVNVYPLSVLRKIANAMLSLDISENLKPFNCWLSVVIPKSVNFPCWALAWEIIWLYIPVCFFVFCVARSHVSRVNYFMQANQLTIIKSFTISNHKVYCPNGPMDCIKCGRPHVWIGQWIRFPLFWNYDVTFLRMSSTPV